jgi:hypothetical protein
MSLLGSVAYIISQSVLAHCLTIKVTIKGNVASK